MNGDPALFTLPDAEPPLKKPAHWDKAGNCTVCEAGRCRCDPRQFAPESKKPAPKGNGKGKVEQNALDGLEAFVAEAQAKAAAPDISAAERHRFEVIVMTEIECFNGPIHVCNRPMGHPVPEEFLRKNRGLIEMERIARFFKAIREDPPASLDRIRATATDLTNPEKAGIISVISGEAPPGREHAAEMMRAMAHCWPFEEFMRFGIVDQYDRGLNIGDVEGFYQMFGGHDGWGYLDKAEIQWMEDFNKQARAYFAKQKKAGRQRGKQAKRAR